MLNVYELGTVYNSNTAAVSNPFWDYIFKQCENAINVGSFPMFLLDNSANAINYENKVIDVFRTPGLLNKEITLGDEIAQYRYGNYVSDPDMVEPVSGELKQLLLVDYLLRSAICYVELFKGNIPQKFLCTRNVALLKELWEKGAIGNITNKDLADPKVCKKLELKTQPLTMSDLRDNTIQFLRIEGSKGKNKGLRIVEPRNMTCLRGANMRITPVYINTLITSMLVRRLQGEILEITYLKDNLVKRTVISTLNVNIATQVFEGNRDRACSVIDYATNVRSSAETSLRGYITLPELLLPLSDDSGCRAVSFRILTVKSINADTFKNPFLRVDLESVPAQYEHYIEMHSRNKPVLDLLYTLIQQYFGKLRGVTDPQAIQQVTAQAAAVPLESLKTQLTSWLSTALLIDKTQTLRNLHTLMIENPMIFSRYTGLRIESNRIDYTEGL